MDEKRLIEELKKKKTKKVNDLLNKKEVNEFALDDFMNCV